VIVFIGIQFYRPNKNSQKQATSQDFLITESVPEKVKTLFQNSCYSCHSNKTNYYWYNNIAPVSWIVDNHIKEGKEKLNFSTWKTLDYRDKAGVVSEIAVSITEGKMPLSSFTFMHPDTKITEADKKLILEWLYTLE
jgi:cytochrome c551/c552